MRSRRWRASAVVTILLTLGLAVLPSVATAQDYADRLNTKPATDITATGATLQGERRCYPDLISQVTWRYTVKINGVWTQVGPERYYECANDDFTAPLESQPVSGLATGTSYEYRIEVVEGWDDMVQFYGVYDAIALSPGESWWRGPVLYDSFTPTSPPPPSPTRVTVDENTNDPPVVAPDRDDVAAGAATVDRCKRGLENVRHEFIEDWVIPPRFPRFKIYFGGQRTSWCWDNFNSITSRRTQFPAGWVSPVGSGGVSHYVWSSSCGPANTSCLVRAEFRARLEAEVPGPLELTIGVNHTFCVGTRIFAGGAHSRNITGGECPGS